MSGHVESNKAKIACRVIEVLEFFDEDHPQATVMDIVRRYNRPQSSTSELLSSLVELGLLYKDAAARSYSPTPRAAMLGAAAQPAMIRNGQLTALIDRITAQTGLSVGVFGMVGPKAQIITWRSTPACPRIPGTTGFGGGLLDMLTGSAAGWLLLSTVATPRRDGIIRRINAEAAADRKIGFAEMTAAIDHCRDEGFAINPAKTLVMRRGRQQRVTGVTVNQQAGLSRRERRRLRAAVHQQRQGEVDPRARQQLAGRLAYVAMLNPAQAAPLLASFRAAR